MAGYEMPGLRFPGLGLLLGADLHAVRAAGVERAARGRIDGAGDVALQHQLIPANYGWQTPMDEGIVPATDTTPIQPLQHVMCNSFGFGGNDSSLILSAP